MSNGFVPLADLVAGLSPADRTFYADVIRRDKEAEAEGTDRAGMLRRIQAHSQCQKCVEAFKAKHPNKPFGIKCVGIYGMADFEAIQAKLRAVGDDMGLDKIRAVYDAPFWSTQHIVAKNGEGDIVPFVPYEYQEEALLCTSPRKVDRWGRGMGKALSLDTPIPTPTGWTTMGQVRANDVVFDADGQPTRVTFATDVMYDHVCYDVVFSDGSVITADAGHLWETWTHRARVAASPRRVARRTGRLAHTRPIPVPSVLTTEEIKQSLLHGNGKHGRVEHNHSVSMAGPLEYPEADLPIDPYVLGVWLGDGTSHCAQLTSADPEILQELNRLGTSSKKLVAPYLYAIGAIPCTFACNGQYVSGGGLHSQLKTLGLLDNKSVPLAYLRGSIEQRLSLLQGLMDTDGTASVTGSCSFDNTNPLLSEAVVELAVSLGFKVLRRPKRATLYGKDCGMNYRVRFTPHLPVFRLQRKLARQRLDKVRRTQFHRYIVEVRDRESAPVKCIGVDNPRHLYLAGEACIPTHNSLAGVVEELHFIANNKKTYTIVVCPSQSQAQMWWDEILFQLENSPTLRDMLLTKKQQPYYYFKFGNGGVLAIFTAGSKSGKGADAVRGQSPRRIRLDEQDYLVDKDYQAIMPLLRRFPKSTFHGSSTPTGLRGMFWHMCNRMIEYREFFHPIMDHPNWGTDQLNEESCMQEAQTMDKYRHEWLAQFGDPSSGVFKSGFVDQAMKPYRLASCVYDPAKFYVLGVDWNGKGTGTRIVVTEFSPATRRRRVVHHEVVDDPAATTRMSMDRIVEINRMWHCAHAFVDAGFGYVQDELIKDIGAQAGTFDADTARLKYVKVIDFGAKLETNALVPNRDPDSKYLANPKDDLLKRRTKPFMVEGTVMAFEMELVEISRDYPLLEEQIRGYRVKTWTKGGAADTYVTDCESGDHDLDAFMLSMLGIELNYGLWHTKETIGRLIQIAHVSGWGMPSTMTTTSVMNAAVQEAIAVDTARARVGKLDAAGVPTRATADQIGQSLQAQFRAAYQARNSVSQMAGQQTAANRVPSRTSFFASSNRPGFGTPGRRFGGS